MQPHQYKQPDVASDSEQTRVSEKAKYVQKQVTEQLNQFSTFRFVPKNQQAKQDPYHILEIADATQALHNNEFSIEMNGVLTNLA